MKNNNRARGERRIKRVPLHQTLLVDLFSGCLEIEEGIPRDSTIQKIYDVPERHEMDIVVEHDSFEPVQEGEIVPFADFSYKIKEDICPICKNEKLVHEQNTKNGDYEYHLYCPVCG